MRTLLLLSWLVIGATDAFGQAPAPKPAQPPATTPAQPAAPRPTQPRRAQPANTRSGLAVTVTDPRGETLPGVDVRLTGPTDREAQTNASGQVNFPGLQSGVYRLHFSGEAVVAFEREVTLRPGQVADVDVVLTAAPVVSPSPPPPAEEPVIPQAAAPAVGPTGAPQTISVPDLLERNFVGTQPRRETVLACSGSMRTTMIQLNMPLPERLYETADAAYYVIGGEGSVRIAGRETKLATNGFVSVPRGTAHSFIRTGRRPLILFAVLSGEPCEEAK